MAVSELSYRPLVPAPRLLPANPPPWVEARAMTEAFLLCSLLVAILLLPCAIGRERKNARRKGLKTTWIKDHPIRYRSLQEGKALCKFGSDRKSMDMIDELIENERYRDLKRKA